MTTHRNFIDDRWIDAPAAKLIPVENPATGEVISAVPDSLASVVDKAVAAARRAQSAWEKLPAIERARHLREIAEASQAATPGLYMILGRISEFPRPVNIAEKTTQTEFSIQHFVPVMPSSRLCRVQSGNGCAAWL